MKKLLFGRWVSIAARLALGAVLVYAAWSKVLDPPAFAHAVSNYRILPPSSVNAAAIVVPWLELVSGLALISGVFRRGGALVAGSLLLVFIAALSIGVVRDVAVDCGCWNLAPKTRTHEEMIATMKLDVLRDVAFALLALQSLLTPVTWRTPTGERR